MKAYDTDVFVIGGGPAGLATAIAARQRGMRVVVADASEPPIDKVCGEGLMPDSLAALSTLGVSPARSDGYPFRGIRFAGPEGTTEAAFPTGNGMGIRRLRLHELLVERAREAGVNLWWGTRATGVEGNCVSLGGRVVHARWIVGADGPDSRVRRWADLARYWQDSRRFGFRSHFRVKPWTDHMEIHWTSGCQLYVTPVAPDEICAVFISRNSGNRLDHVLPRFTKVEARLRGCEQITRPQGAVTASRILRSVYSGSVALVGDASGSVDAITGEGLCLSFRQALALADAVAEGNLRRYQAKHRRLSLRPALMARLMMFLDESDWLRGRALSAFTKHPDIFDRMLAMHVGNLPASRFLAEAVVPLACRLVISSLP